MRAELDRVALLTGKASATAAPADRLHIQGGSALVTDPIGWLLAKGLPQRAECAHPACDDGLRLDTRTDCVTCEKQLTNRRSIRHALVREAVAQLPDNATGDQRRTAVDERLHRHAMLRAEQQVFDRQRAAQRRAEADARRAVQRAQAEAAEAAHRALPCEDCGTEQAGGLCPSCWAARSTRSVIRECVNLAFAGSADRADLNTTARRVQAELRETMLQARPAGASREDVRASDLLAAQGAVAEYRARALDLLARSPLADVEAELAHDTARRSAHRHPTRASALAAADRAAEQARTATARYLLLQRLETVQRLRERADRIRATAAAPTREAVNA
ncbi:hypothetical protein ACFWP2_29225 [Kitasatospora sp. NPDC058444]|uniref:hypothetical protein n=1 Tax=Kitasatospora sp. NPDC058444 TaxID=3346504 RepID=UPI0036685236